MSVDRFKFVSPGVFINEIDDSGIPPQPTPSGPAIIGRLTRGPGNRPVVIDSMSEFIEIFGNPEPGGKGGDVWREGNFTAPTYAAYAAQAYLRNDSPLTVVRVLGEAHDSATTEGVAGWKTSAAHARDNTPSNNGGAYGLFLFSSGSGQFTRQGGIKLGDTYINPGGKVARNRASAVGSLAAVWYFDAGAIELSGNLLDNVSVHRQGGANIGAVGFKDIAANSVAVLSSETTKREFTTVIYDKSNTGKKITFNFDRNSDKYIRKVFNTNPTLLGSAVSDQKGYWLGETFDRHAADMHASGTLGEGALAADDSLYGVIVALQAASGRQWGVNSISTQAAKTGWFIGQDLTSNTTDFDAGSQQKLFRICALDSGEWASRNIKVSISDHRAPTDVDPYGSFTVTLRHVRDHDGAIKVIEKFSSCNLNPNSANYIASKIGDIYQEWDEAAQRYRTYGTHPNQSRHVRVEMNSDVDDGLADAALLPWGFFGAPRYKSIEFTGVPRGANLMTGSTFHSVSSSVEQALNATALPLFMTGAVVSASIPGGVPFQTHNFFNSFDFRTGTSEGTTEVLNTIVGLPDKAGVHSASVVFPTFALRVSSSTPAIKKQNMSHFGVSTYRSPTTNRFDESYLDLVGGGKGVEADTYDADGSNTEVPFIFTLDDVVAENAAARNVKSAFYHSGSRKNNQSYTALRGGYTDLIRSGFTKFTAPMVGGFDGLNIKESEPFGNHVIGGSTVTFKNNYAANSIKRAVDACSDPEVVDMNLLSVPGVRAPLLTDHVISVAEDRGDCLAVIDIEKGGYQPSTETTSDFKTRITNSSVDECVNTLKQRGINSSYACSYFPWVKIQDEINAQQVWVPPSVVALGTMASTAKRGELWFAPAGFTRGGLSEGSAGVPVLAVSQRLTSDDRDDLYENNINPIASFPAEGIVIFGQKTLQSTPSALDRINVRRLVIFLKKQISRISSTLLFEQNVQSTWNRFRGLVEPFLLSVKSRFGVTEFKVVLDETTTTPDLQDRNIMYAKIFIKPAKSLEFIAIDFIISGQGAAFED